VLLKAENLQRTGSFKVRGVAAKLASLGDIPNGVVAASAGNHAQAVAAAAVARGIPCEVFVPDDAPMAKVEAAKGQGAIVHVGGNSVDACIVSALERAEAGGLAFIHPFDDPAIVAGQGSLGLELLEDVPDLARVVVPVGGGGLCAGVALAIKDKRPDVEIIGVQAAACAPYRESIRTGVPVEATSALTIADGIAVKRPGGIPLEILRALGDGMAIVTEDETAEAMALLLERCKLVVEGAGAVGVAALLAGKVEAAPSGATVAVLSGGNVDAGLLAQIARRHETESGRRLVLLTRIPDRPGGLARLLATVAGTGANLIDVSHVREGLDLHVRETAVELVLETRGHDDAEHVLSVLFDEGYPAQVLR
jgi:threonine dehydratase